MRVTALTENGPFCPIPPPRLRELRLRRGIYAMSAIGLEKRCSRCKEYWPADTEFYYSVASDADGLNSWCKACYTEWRLTSPAWLAAA